MLRWIIAHRSCTRWLSDATADTEDDFQKLPLSAATGMKTHCWGFQSHVTISVDSWTLSWKQVLWVRRQTKVTVCESSYSCADTWRNFILHSCRTVQCQVTVGGWGDYILTGVCLLCSNNKTNWSCCSSVMAPVYVCHLMIKMDYWVTVSWWVFSTWRPLFRSYSKRHCRWAFVVVAWVNMFQRVAAVRASIRHRFMVTVDFWTLNSAIVRTVVVITTDRKW